VLIRQTQYKVTQHQIASEIAIGLGAECHGLEAFGFHYNLAAARRPDAKMDAAGLRLGADRQAPDGRRLWAAPVRPRLPDDMPVVILLSPSTSDGNPIRQIYCHGRPHHAADGCRDLNQASRVRVVSFEELEAR
jgi:hypothetical protein